MILGIGSYTFGWEVGGRGWSPDTPLTAEGLIRRAALLKVGLIQIGDNIPLSDYSSDRLFDIGDLINRNGLTVEFGARGLRPENLDRYISLCGFFNSKILRFIVDRDDIQPSIHEIIGILEERKNALVAAGITLAIENHDRFKTCDLVYIMQSLNCSNIGICMDTVNSLGIGEGFEAVIEGLAPYTVNLHIKDFTISRPDHKMGFIINGAIAGTGLLDIPALIVKLKKYNRCKTAILEQWVVPEPNLEQTIKKEYRWACDSLDYLRQVKDLQL